MNAIPNRALVTGHVGRVGTLIAMSVGLFALAAAAQTAKEVKGATPLVAVPNEAPAKLVVDLFEMHSIGVEALDMRKADRDVIGECDPQPTLTLRQLQDFVAGGFAQHRLGRVSSKPPRSLKFDLRKPSEIRWACNGDRVQRRHVVG
jgi:hypothetical protein